MLLFHGKGRIKGRDSFTLGSFNRLNEVKFVTAAYLSASDVVGIVLSASCVFGGCVIDVSRQTGTQQKSS